MKCPLNGKPCNKYKGFHITEKINGKVESFSVCEDCLYSQIKKNDNSKELIKPCSKCGTKLESVISGGRFGCSDCYVEFEENLVYILSSIHGGMKDIKHKGRVPDLWFQKNAEETNPIKFATELAYKLKAASKNEQYEKASFLKNSIEKFSSLLLKLQNANETRVPTIKKALAKFIYEFNKQERLTEGLE